MAEKNDSFPIVIPSGPLIYRTVKEYIKENGHLTMLNLDTAECRVLIILYSSLKREVRNTGTREGELLPIRLHQ